MNRRTLLKASAALASLGLPVLQALADTIVAEGEGEGEPFSFERLKRRAKMLANRPYRSRTEDLPAALTHLQPLDFQQIHYNRHQALWSDNPAFDLRVHFFHVGMHFNLPGYPSSRYGPTSTCPTAISSTGGHARR